MGATRFAPTLLLCAAIAACTAPAGSSPEARPSPSAPEQSAPPELAAQLPPLPLDRDASAILHTELEGRDTFDRSANAGNFADTLSLTAAADALEWGIWRFPLGAADQVDLQSVVISCSVLVGEEMYVALANYGMGRWEIKPALAYGEEGASYPLNNADYRSPADCFYIAAMAYNGVIALVSDIELTVDSDAIYTLVDDSAVSGSSAPLALVSGHPAVAYVGAGCLKYCRAADAAGSLWGELVTLHEPESPLKRVGTSANLLVVDGNPAVGYCDEEHTDLYFVRAEDALGSGWGEPQLIDDAGDVGRCTSLAVVGGRPAMAYSDHTNQQLKYVRALDATGSAWGSPVTVDDGTAGAAGEFCSLAVVSNQPAIAYTFQPSIIRMRYVRADDTTGETWGEPHSFPLSGSLGEYCQLAVIDGSPAIAFNNCFTDSIEIIRAMDASGASWADPVTIYGEPDFSSGRLDLTVIGGVPMVIFYRFGSFDLWLAAATDAAGTSWDEPVGVYFHGSSGSGSSLMDLGGLPAVSITVIGEQSLLFALLTEL